MAILSPTFVAGVIVLVYLASFVVFAILRIVTGISIQRIGFTSLRRLAYTPKDGVRIAVRGLGLKIHRPTFAQPTWVSVVFTELAVTIDLDALNGGQQPFKRSRISSGEREDGEGEKQEKADKHGERGQPKKRERSKSWQQLTRLKNRIKHLHRKINWIKLVDVVSTNSSITVTKVGSVQVGSFTMAVDTRRKMVDRGRMFARSKKTQDSQRPAEWMVTVRSVLFTPEGQESLEILDHATLNVNGMLYKELDGLRDAAIALKLGRVHVPIDDFKACMESFKNYKAEHDEKNESEESGISVLDIMVELDRPGSQESSIVQTVSDSKEFFNSILRGVKEVQFAVSYVGLTSRIHTIQTGSTPLYINASMKEVGIDLHRLDSRSPAHRMYFSPKDIAHEALAAALSITIGIDEGRGEMERLFYIPMATMTVRTTLPSKTVEVVMDNSADERNTNMLFANCVVTSPSLDLDPKHLPIVIAMLQRRPRQKKNKTNNKRAIISRLLPKAKIKFTMHEPVVRIALPPMDSAAHEDNFDLIISSISSVSLDMESSHSAKGSGDAQELHYSLASALRVQTHDLYYQTSKGCRYNLVQAESMDLKVQVNASPEVHVVASGTLNRFSIRMVRPEISEGVRHILKQLRVNVEPTKKGQTKVSKDFNFVRAMPCWLLHFQFQATDFGVEVTGVDSDISEDTRGVAMQLESLSAEYRAQRIEPADRQPRRRRAGSVSLDPDVSLLEATPASPRESVRNATDGRRLTIHVRGLEAFMVESAAHWEPEPFLSMPKFEVALSVSSDKHGPVFHINSSIKTILVQYSLYRHYALGVAAMVLKNSFMRTRADDDAAAAHRAAQKLNDTSDRLSPMPSPHEENGTDRQLKLKELLIVDLKVALVQLKANLPSDPPLMIQLYGLEAGRHRWAAPFLHTRLARLYAEAPKMKQVWARIVSLRSLSIDLRTMKKKTRNGDIQEEKLIDVNTEAIRLAVPHQFVLHTVFDNIVNTIKASEQLHHRFKTGTNDYILTKSPEGPKHVPKISIRSRALLFEVEDGAFEWKLGTIYRTGLVEQTQRLARDEVFRVKARKINEEDQQSRRGSSRYRAKSSHRQDADHPRSRANKSDKEQSPKRGRSGGRGRRPRMRYDPEGMCGMDGKAKIPVEEAREKMQVYNSQSWKKRIDHAYALQNSGMKDLRGVFWGPDEIPDDLEHVEEILEVSPRPALMGTLISDVHIMIDKPSFPLSQLPEYLHKMGKGMPYDMQYTLLIPLHIQINMGETRISLRDYPLPLLHVPYLKPGQSAKLPSWSLKTDFVIAEEFRGPQSVRHVEVEIVPPRDTRPEASNAGRFAIDVRRTVSPVKSYSDLNIDVNTAYPTRITWGASYQPAIQDMMMVIEGFTKPERDPSERAGFWDKIRLSFHSRVLVAWRGEGDVHFMLKGTQDPYAVTGNGAGFMMCWRKDVRWSIWRENDPKKFMTVDSADFILAVPDYSRQAGNDSSKPQHGEDTTADAYRHGASFKKVIMKLSGNVQWLAGLVFERDTDDGKRSFEFEPHYNVVLREPEFAKASGGVEYDAFRGFRSQHIHLSIAVQAPVNRDWSTTNAQPSESYNTVHLTPRFFTHFFAWWSMFGSTMSLPIRQGPLWPGIEKSSKKFGRHLATIKYNLLLAPLFLSHIYKHKEVEDYTDDVVSATGLKIRLDSFMLDMHQRREEFHTQDKGRKTHSKTTGMKIHKAQLDLLSADVRAVSASIAGTTCDDLKKASTAPLQSQSESGTNDLSQFEISDNDYSWVDMDDFVELDWILPSKSNPETKIMPLAFAPRITYFRQTDHGDTISGDPNRTSSFGHEPTHNCIMSKDDDPQRVQCQLIEGRLKQLQNERENHARELGEAELAYLRNDGQDPALKARYDDLAGFEPLFRDKHLFLESMLRRMTMRVHTDNKSAVPDGDADRDSDGETPQAKEQNPETNGIDSTPADFVSDFNNRFVIHNMQLKWNNSLRNTILRYIHQVGQRRGFVYYLSRRAVKFILDIVEEQNKAKTHKEKGTPSPERAPSTDKTSSASSTKGKDEDHSKVQERIKGLLADAKKFVKADDHAAQGDSIKFDTDHLASGFGEDYIPQNSYHLRLIAPQIQLQSEKNSDSLVLITAKAMELKVVKVMDKERLFDDVSGLVQNRFSVAMDSTQFFVTQKKWFSAQLLSMYSGSGYGAPTGTAWPPWVPMEVMFDFEKDPFGFKRVVQKTSASLRYEKYNTLRLKYNDEIGAHDDDSSEEHTTSSDNIETRMDHLWVEFPQVRAICDSEQYYALYVIVLDLLLYSEPLEKKRSERLEKIMLASDFSDLRGAPEMVITLQERINQLEEIKTQFQIHSQSLDKQGWKDRILLEQDLASCEDELSFIMKAITTSQRKYDGSQNNGLLRWNISSKQIVWHLIRDKDLPLMEFQLNDAEYDRTDNSDGSHVNLLQMGKVVGLNLMPDAIYPNMIAPYHENDKGVSFDKDSDTKMLRVYWHMLEAIAGIPVMDHFEVNLFPMKLQLEREVGKKLFEYIFPGRDDKNGKEKNKHSGSLRPMQPVADLEEDGQSTKPTTVAEAERQDTNIATRAGSLEYRLKPTMTSKGPHGGSGKAKSTHSVEGSSSSRFSLFRSSKHAHGQAQTPTIQKKASSESLQSTNGSRSNGLTRSDTVNSTAETLSGKPDGGKPKGLFSRSSNKLSEASKQSDDLTKMMNRASEYKTLAYVKIPSMVLCLSYKGKGERNIEDVNDFVFRLPQLEYRNKTWSNMDLALALKKDVIKALLSHTGAIIGNKFSKHRPSATQQSKLRELASSSMLLAPNGGHDKDGSIREGSTRSTASSMYNASSTDRGSTNIERSGSPRRSFQSTHTAETADSLKTNLERTQYHRG